METFTWKTEPIDSLIQLSVSGYFSETSGKLLETEIQPFLDRGIVRVLIDFSQCPLMNSPGVVALMDLALKIANDYNGRVAVCGLDALKKKVFQVAGVFDYVEATDSPAEGRKLLSQP